MKKIILTSLLLSLSLPCFAEKLVLKSGRIIEGKIREKTDKYVKIDFSGVELTFFMDEVISIEGKTVSSAPFQERQLSSSEIAFETLVEKDGSEIFKHISPAVVNIRAGENEGSGFIIDKKGVIVTNWHVTADSDNITVVLKDGKEYSCKEIVNYDVLRDICILQIDALDEFPYVPLGDYNRIDIGQTAYVIGNPLGLKYLISDGIVAQKDDRIFYGKIIQFTCPISPGSSGSPLLNTRGQAIGLVSSIITIPNAQNLNLAVSSDDIRDTLSQNKHLTPAHYAGLNKNQSIISQAQQLIKQGEVKEGYLVLAEVLKKTCSQGNINTQDCSSLFFEMLIITQRMTSERTNTFVDWLLKDLEPVNIGKDMLPLSDKEAAQRGLTMDEALMWANENVSLIETFGGLRKVYDMVISTFSTDVRGKERELKEMLCTGYYNIASIAALHPTGKNAFYEAFNKIKEAFSDTQAVKNLLESERRAKETFWTY